MLHYVVIKCIGAGAYGRALLCRISRLTDAEASSLRVSSSRDSLGAGQVVGRCQAQDSAEEGSEVVVKLIGMPSQNGDPGKSIVSLML
jgi:hypothetical protein